MPQLQLAVMSAEALLANLQLFFHSPRRWTCTRVLQAGYTKKPKKAKGGGVREKYKSSNTPFVCVCVCVCACVCVCGEGGGDDECERHKAEIKTTQAP